MAFQAGYVNVGAFVVSGNFVSHVTGTSSQIGMNIATSNWILFFEFLLVLVCFIIGAAFSGHYVGRAMLEKREPDYVRVLATKSLAFAAVLYLSHDFLFHDVTHIGILNIEFTLLSLLSFCCGVQNSTCALSTAGFLKPTHMTGLSTDLGMNLAKMYALRKKSPTKFKKEFEKNMLRIGILGSFILGGVISMIIFRTNGSWGFLFPFVSSLSFTALAIIEKIQSPFHETHIKFFKGTVITTFLATLLHGFSLV